MKQNINVETFDLANPVLDISPVFRQVCQDMCVWEKIHWDNVNTHTHTQSNFFVH